MLEHATIATCLNSWHTTRLKVITNQILGRLAKGGEQAVFMPNPDKSDDRVLSSAVHPTWVGNLKIVTNLCHPFVKI